MTEVATSIPQHSVTLTHYHQTNRSHHSFSNSQAISTILIDLCSTVPVASICPVSSVNGQTDYISTTAQCVPPSCHYITAEGEGVNWDIVSVTNITNIISWSLC